jgi:hypothetical protein
MYHFGMLMGMVHQEQLNILGLTHKEEHVLAALRDGYSTPLLIARETKVSRPGVYDILVALKKRGLVESRIRDGKKYWGIAERRAVEERFFHAKRAVLGLHEGATQVYGVDDSVVIIHKGVEAVKGVLEGMFLHHQNERMYTFIGNEAGIQWDHIFTPKEINAFNRSVKKNRLIVEMITPFDFFEEQTRKLGLEWAKDFEGRTARNNVIADEYFRHGGQLFLFKNAIYLLALGEDTIIEVRHSEIQKMLLTFFRYMQESSRVIDVNELLRGLISERTK